MTGRMALLGAGTSGCAWAARFALMGWQVRVFDPEPGAAARMADALSAAAGSLPALYDVALPPVEEVSYHDSLAEAVSGVDWVQDGLPDRVSLKRKMYQAVQAGVGPDVVIAGTSETLSVEDLQGCAPRPAQIVAVSGRAPVWLFPQVRVEGGAVVAPDLLAKAKAVLAGIGMVLDADGLAEVLPDGDPGTVVAVLRALKSRNDPGLGAALADHESALAPSMPDLGQPPVTLDRQVPPDWVDYNGHMNEAHYLTAFSHATDRLLLWAGMDADCVAQGHSVFTVETHIRHLGEVDIGTRIVVTTRVIDGGGKRLHVWHEMRSRGALVATGEQMLLHVDLATRRPAAPRADVGAVLARATQAHAGLPAPEGMGRAVGDPR
ncbi:MULTISPECIES: thioesterase family protein [Paracoccaceae]|uniref:thioesterase family protein n=1 Tax=Rhodobacterales TaxID=204455 RepID=UPI001D0B4753|nr:thioesterase family protein [Boseongicola sp. H5]